jgi:DNA-binding NarL/FixJ family response regulator
MANPITTPSRIVSIDDSRYLGTHLASFLRQQVDMEWVAQLGSIREARATIEQLRPDIILLDLSLPDGSGLDFLPELKLLLPTTRIVILTVFDQDEAMVRAIEQGCTMFLVKRAGLRTIHDSLREAASMHDTPSSEIALGIARRFQRRRWTRPLLPRLTSTEARCLDLFAQGHSVQETERVLRLTPEAARTVLQSIFRKLQVQSQTEVLRGLFRRGWWRRGDAIPC